MPKVYSMSARKIVQYLYLATLMTVVALSLRLLISQPTFDTDILNLIPPVQRDRFSEEVVRNQTVPLSSRVAVVVQNRDPKSAESSTATLAEAMRASGLFKEVRDRVSPQDIQPLLNLFLSYPFQLATPSSVSNFNDLLRAVQETAFSPEGLQWLGTIDRDPLLLFPQYLKRVVQQNPRFSIRNGFIHVDSPDSSNVLITALLAASALDRSLQGDVVRFFAERPSLAGSNVLPSGIVFFGHESAQRTEREVTLISFVTIGALVVLLWWVFRSLWPVTWIAVSIASSFLVALFISHYTLQYLGLHGLHLITIGFGSSLLGVCIDYAIHYYVALRLSWPSRDAPPLARIKRGLLLGYATSSVAFLGIAFAPFPGLQQLALFCVIGLTVSLLNVFILFPLVLGLPSWDPRLSRLSSAVEPVLQPRSFWPLTVVLVPLIAIGLSRASTIDDIRVLNTPSPELLAQQRKVAQLIGFAESGTMAIIEGASEEEVLQREEVLREQLLLLKDKGQLEGYRALSLLVPSMKQQAAYYSTLSALFLSTPGSVDLFARTLNLPERSQKLLTVLASRPEPPRYLTLSECLRSEACESVKDLWAGSVEGRLASIVSLQGASSLVAQQLQGLPGVRVINRADSISEALGEYRRSAMIATGIFYILIWLSLGLRYGIRRALRVFISPLLGASAAVAVLGFSGVPLNVFSIFALMVLLGVSVDYSLFFAEDQDRSAATGLAVALSALTTILSFGLLSWSSTPALQSFGIVLSVGVLVAALSAARAAPTSGSL
jgi:predicted exporter